MSEQAVTPQASPEAPTGPQNDASVVDGGAEGQAPATQQKDDSARRFLALSRKEKQIQAERAKVSESQRALAAERAQMQQERAEAAALRQKLASVKTDPFGFMKEAGYDWDQLSQMKLNEGQLTSEMVLRIAEQKADEKVASLRAEQRRELEARKAQVQAEQRKTIEQFHAKVTDELHQKKDEFELINLQHHEQDVIELIQLEFHKSGRLLTASEAGQLVEDTLVEQLEKGTKTKRWLARSQQLSQDQESGTSERGSRMGARERTLDNRMTGTSVPTTKKLTQAQKEQRLYAKLDQIWATTPAGEDS